MSRCDDVFSRGFFPGAFANAIGLPHYFNYETKADVDAVDLDAMIALKRRPEIVRRWKQWWTDLTARFGASSSSSSDVNARSDVNADGGFDWTSPAGVAYKESLLLSPMAKRFAITRTVDIADKMHFVLTMLVGYAGVELSFGLYRFSFNRLTLVQKRMVMKPLIFTCTALGVTIVNIAVQLR